MLRSNKAGLTEVIGTAQANACVVQPLVACCRSGTCSPNASVVLACGGWDPPYLNNRSLLADQVPFADQNHLVNASSVEVPYIDCHMSFKASARLSDSANPLHTFDLVNIGSNVDCLLVSSGLDEPSYYEPLP